MEHENHSAMDYLRLYDNVQVLCDIDVVILVQYTYTLTIPDTGHPRLANIANLQCLYSASLKHIQHSIKQL